MKSLEARKRSQSLDEASPRDPEGNDHGARDQVDSFRKCVWNIVTGKQDDLVAASVLQ